MTTVLCICHVGIMNSRRVECQRSNGVWIAVKNETIQAAVDRLRRHHPVNRRRVINHAVASHRLPQCAMHYVETSMRTTDRRHTVRCPHVGANDAWFTPMYRVQMRALADVRRRSARVCLTSYSSWYDLIYTLSVFDGRGSMNVEYTLWSLYVTNQQKDYRYSSVAWFKLSGDVWKIMKNIKKWFIKPPVEYHANKKLSHCWDSSRYAKTSDSSRSSS